MMTLEELYAVKKSLEELTPDVEDFSWGPSYEFAKQRKAEALKILRREIKALKKKTPFDVGRQVYKDGLGVSDLWGAVENDEELAEAHRGYEFEMTKAIKRSNQKEIKSLLGFSRIGRNNV